MVIPQFGVGHTTVVQQHPLTRTRGQVLADGVMHVDAQSQLHQQQQWVHNILDLVAKPNTKKAYEPKEAEFLEFCHEVYGNSDAPLHVNFDKVYRFLFYVSHRQKRKRGKKKATSGRSSRFNLVEYNQVWSARRGLVMSPGNAAPHVSFGDLPTDAPQWNTFNQYRCAIKKLHENNLKNKLTGEDWARDIWTPWCKDLEQIVKQRKAILGRVFCQEKMNPDFTLLDGKGKDKLIEEMMWREAFARTTLRNAFPSIRYEIVCFLLVSHFIYCANFHL